MKFYETHFDEYLESLNKHNIHPELVKTIAAFPNSIADMCNQIVYGPPGSGKYSQVLKILEKYSHTRLKYNKKITVQTDKQKYIYHISDVHYEVDMSLLGCNSKIIWHELYLQIVDIVSMCPTKQGIILCKNFHAIHTELLDIFYSYLQQYNHSQILIKIKFILLTDHISFIPNNILNSCQIIAVKKPVKSDLMCIIANKVPPLDVGKASRIIDAIDTNTVLNIKEFASFSLVPDISRIPVDIFNTICNTIIKEMTNHQKMSIPAFRDTIYDVLVYNLDVNECIWYILSHFIGEHTETLPSRVITEMTAKVFEFFKNYNNNYRPIYHLESILFYFIIKIYGYAPDNDDESSKSTRSPGNRSKRTI